MANPIYNPLVDDALRPVTTDLANVADRIAAFPPVAGVQLAAYGDGAWTAAASGFADVDGEVLVRDDTRFRPGSITKLLTATMVMQCVDDGLVGLDDEVGPRLGLAIDTRVRVRHLLSHSSGIDAGDLFVDAGREDELSAYAALVEPAGLLFAPGTMFSYNNAGFALAGLLVERLRDEAWESVARTRVLDPLGMSSTEFIGGRDIASRNAMDAAGDPPYAVGHLVVPGQLVRVPAEAVIADPACTRGLAPAGGTLVSTAGDLVRFAAAHLGVGEPILGPASATLMREVHAPAPGGVAKMAGVGFGWQIWHHGDRTIARIGGANPGQSGLVAVDPVAQTALVALTNSDQGINIVNGLLDGFGPAVAKVDGDPSDDLSPYAGVYESHAMALAVEAADDGQSLTARLVDVADVRIGATQASTLNSLGLPNVDEIAKMTFTLSPVDRTTFSSPIGPFAFLRADGDPDGAPQWLRWRMRVLRRRD